MSAGNGRSCSPTGGGRRAGSRRSWDRFGSAWTTILVCSISASYGSRHSTGAPERGICSPTSATSRCSAGSSPTASPRPSRCGRRNAGGRASACCTRAGTRGGSPPTTPSTTASRPGRLLLVALLQSSFERGDAEFDLLLGDEEYKWHFATDVRLVDSVGSPSVSQRMQRLSKRAAHRFPGPASKPRRSAAASGPAGPLAERDRGGRREPDPQAIERRWYGATHRLRDDALSLSLADLLDGGGARRRGRWVARGADRHQSGGRVGHAHRRAPAASAIARSTSSRCRCCGSSSPSPAEVCAIRSGSPPCSRGRCVPPAPISGSRSGGRSMSPKASWSGTTAGRRDQPPARPVRRHAGCGRDVRR